jgi:hypothetical protein
MMQAGVPSETTDLPMVSTDTKVLVLVPCEAVGYRHFTVIESRVMMFPNHDAIFGQTLKMQFNLRGRVRLWFKKMVVKQEYVLQCGQKLVNRDARPWSMQYSGVG